MSRTPFHLDVITGRYFFAKVQDADVDRNMIARADDVRAFVCPDLKIEPPKIVWVRPAPPTLKRGVVKFDYQEELDPVVRLRKDITGGCTPSNWALHEIWILGDLKAFPDLEYAVAHELRHAAQKKNCPDVFKDECRAEGDAYPYGYEALERYLDSRGSLTTELRKEIDKKRTMAQAVFRYGCPDGVFEIIKCNPVDSAS